MAYLRPSQHKKLTPDELKYTFETKNFELKPETSSQKPIETIIGQERALKAIRIGVELRSQGYNIFITGISGTGKFTSIKRVLETLSPDCSTMDDYAYVNNFKDDDRPILLKFKAGKAVVFRKDMERCINVLKEHIPKALETTPFVNKKKSIINKFRSEQNKVIAEFEKKLQKDGLTLGQIKEGEAARPEILVVKDDKVYFIQQLDELVQQKQLTKRKADSIVKKYLNHQDGLQAVFKEGIKITNLLKDDLDKLEQETARKIVEATFEDIIKKYKDKNTRKYLKDVVNDIIMNVDNFKGIKPKNGPGESDDEIDYFKNYEVNVILDNSNQKGCPVVIETSPTYQNLFGVIEKFNDGSGGWYTDFTRIKAGSILRANGGYLILNATDTYTEPGVWRALKRTLYYGMLEIQDNPSQYQVSANLLKPESIRINTKVILIGSDYLYTALSEYEDDFNKMFKIKAEFDYEMKRTEKGVEQYVQVINQLISKEKLQEFDASAIAKILEYSARYIGEKNKLTTRFSYILDLARESDFWARDVQAKVVNSYHVEQAYNSAKERHGLYESKLSEMINDGTILIDTEGTRVGQVNGLAVYGDDKYSYGKPTRITASVSLGNGSIINVEREAGLSGSTHNKGVLVISGYLKEKFGRNIPLSFNASLVFEQGYGPIDGDSASITEIAALLSTMAGIPIKQSFAITGSVNQKGDIQPIGGVNEKIEGYFDLCNEKGLTGKQGVIMPVQNVKDLMLKDEVIKAAEEKKFHIYPVSKVEDALELLMGVRAGKMMKNGRYQANTIFGCVDKCLREMRHKIKPAPAKNNPQNKQVSKSKKK
ncbi:MAG: ATP-binding protein [Bacteroidota bacterium]